MAVSVAVTSNCSSRLLSNSRTPPSLLLTLHFEDLQLLHAQFCPWTPHFLAGKLLCAHFSMIMIPVRPSSSRLFLFLFGFVSFLSIYTWVFRFHGKCWSVVRGEGETDSPPEINGCGAQMLTFLCSFVLFEGHFLTVQLYSEEGVWDIPWFERNLYISCWWALI